MTDRQTMNTRRCARPLAVAIRNRPWTGLELIRALPLVQLRHQPSSGRRSPSTRSSRFGLRSVTPPVTRSCSATNCDGGSASPSDQQLILPQSPRNNKKPTCRPLRQVFGSEDVVTRCGGRRHPAASELLCEASAAGLTSQWPPGTRMLGIFCGRRGERWLVWKILR